MHAFWKPSRSVTSLLSWHKSTLHHGLCPCAHGGTPKGSHVHSERRTGMLRYSLDHTSAQCSQSLSVEGAFPEDTCFSHQQKTEKTLSSATHQINTPLVCANVMKVARATGHCSPSFSMYDVGGDGTSGQPEVSRVPRMAYGRGHYMVIVGLLPRKSTCAWSTYCGKNRGVQHVAEGCGATMLRAHCLRLGWTSGSAPIREKYMPDIGKLCP